LRRYCSFILLEHRPFSCHGAKAEPYQAARLGASFAAGAMTGSFVFFFALGYGAKRLMPIFAKPFASRTLEAIIGLVMWSISFRLVAGA
jgi:arginine exporter protein ArgO